MSKRAPDGHRSDVRIPIGHPVDDASGVQGVLGEMLQGARPVIANPDKLARRQPLHCIGRSGSNRNEVLRVHGHASLFECKQQMTAEQQFIVAGNIGAACLFHKSLSTDALRA